MANANTRMTLEDAVAEVMTMLIGIDYTYDPAMDRFHVVTRYLNRALRQVALEHEWSYYADTADVGVTWHGQTGQSIGHDVRVRAVNDDAIRLADANGNPRVWAYLLPRDALHKYRYRDGLWATATRNHIQFSRPLESYEAGLSIQVPVMREPRQFTVPAPGTEIPEVQRRQYLDFDYPDLVTARAAYIYAQSDPVLQPRAQTLEAQYKDIMYQLVERDERHTISADMNTFQLPIDSGIRPERSTHGHPHSDGVWF